jgi:hypothetical protein
MSSGLADLQARETVKRLQLLRMKLDTFTAHAKALKAMSQHKSGLDDRDLLGEANMLLRELGTTFQQYQSATAKSNSIGRSLPSGPGGVNPLKFEMRAASDQFLKALRQSERAVLELQNVTMTALNDPLRTPSTPGDLPLENIIDVVSGFMDMLTKWLEHRRSGKR